MEAISTHTTSDFNYGYIHLNVCEIVLQKWVIYALLITMEHSDDC